MLTVLKPNPSSSFRASTCDRLWTDAWAGKQELSIKQLLGLGGD